MLKQVLFIFSPLFFLLFLLKPVFAEESIIIRVGLASQLNQAEFRVMQGEYQLLDAASGLPIGLPQKGERWTIRKEGYNLKVLKEDVAIETPYLGPILLTPVDNTQTNVFRFQNVQYRDNLLFQNETNGILVVNSLNIEKYLYGVVGSEMGTSAPLEALKAQAIVSRSYALSNKGKSTRYDVGIDTNTQVYKGYDAESLPGWSNVKKAVDSTKGLVIYYNGELIRAFFHANSGGYTENSENVWNEKLPYLRAVASPWDEYAVSYPYQTPGGWPANSYQWETNLTRDELREKIAGWNAKSSNKVEIGEILDFNLSRNQKDTNAETLSGRVTRLDFVGTGGIKSFTKDGIRSVLGLKSTLFDLQLDSTVTVLNGRNEKNTYNVTKDFQVLGAGKFLTNLNGPEAKYFVKGDNSNRSIPKVFEKVVIKGKGHGHGLGMSQWGARGMAAAGYNYREIILQYYNQGRDDGRLTIETYH